MGIPSLEGVNKADGQWPPLREPLIMIKEENLMAEARASVKHIRIAPRKVRIVIDLIRNKPVGTAIGILRNTPKVASPVVEKLLLSAMANAENNHHMSVAQLYVAEIYADQGPTLKRIQPRARGTAFRIEKKTSHITLVLREKE